MTSFDDILAMAAGRPEDTVSLCLRANLVAEHRKLEAQLRTASRDAISLGEPAPAKAIAARITALERQMNEASVPFRLQALEPLACTRFMRTQPERGKDEPDEDWDTRWHKWICVLVATVVVDPQMTPEQVELLVEKLSPSQWGQLSDAAWTLNAQRESIPFSAAASALTATSGDE